MKKYWVGVIVLSVIFGCFLVWYKQKMFSPKKMTEMIDGASVYKGKTEDYCLYQTPWDPKEPDERFIKILFECGGKQSLNKISWATVINPTLSGVIKQIAQINGMVYPKLGLYCQVNGKIEEDNNYPINSGDEIICQVPI